MSLSNTEETTVQQQECPSLEKTVKVSQVPENRKDSTSERNGDFRVVANAGSKDVKLASDGKTVLIPQPSDDPEDVLNWRPAKKYRVLLSLVVASLVWRKLLKIRKSADCWTVDRFWYYMGIGMELIGVLVAAPDVC